MGHSKQGGMPEGDSADIERIIANTINETARGDPDALAARVVPLTRVEIRPRRLNAVLLEESQ